MILFTSDAPPDRRRQQSKLKHQRTEQNSLLANCSI